MGPVGLLWCVAVLLVTGVVAAVGARQRAASSIVYGVCLAASAVAFVIAAASLIEGGTPSAEVQLPLGLPWLGAHFRLDALAAFFLVVVNLGGGTASLYGIGYGAHEEAPERVLPFFPAFLAGMNLVVLAHDAFTFLFTWEFMSLSSWALVMAHHRERGNASAGDVCRVMARF